jgi:predicted HicB family RNase H-like nuclease
MSDFAYRPVDSAMPVSAHERHTEGAVFRLSPRLLRALEQLAEREQTSVSEVVREALAARWGLK